MRLALTIGTASLTAALLLAQPWRTASGGAAPASPPLPDFSQWPAGEERKAHFFEYLRPLLQAENARIQQQRQRLVALTEPLAVSQSASRSASHSASRSISRTELRWLRGLARDYRLEPRQTSPRRLLARLLRRVDTVPVSLGLAQAAKESAWGTSRFAVEGNALFGQRCFVAGCGMVPGARLPGLSHEVEAFATPRAAVESYVRNLNTHPDYRPLRELRAELRGRGEPVTGFALARTLGRYSERRDRYVREVRQMIRYNDLGPTPSR